MKVSISIAIVLAVSISIFVYAFTQPIHVVENTHFHKSLKTSRDIEAKFKVVKSLNFFDGIHNGLTCMGVGLRNTFENRWYQQLGVITKIITFPIYLILGILFGIVIFFTSIFQPATIGYYLCYFPFFIFGCAVISGGAPIAVIIIIFDR